MNGELLNVGAGLMFSSIVLLGIFIGSYSVSIWQIIALAAIITAMIAMVFDRLAISRLSREIDKLSSSLASRRAERLSSSKAFLSASTPDAIECRVECLPPQASERNCSRMASSESDITSDLNSSLLNGTSDISDIPNSYVRPNLVWPSVN